MKLRPKIAGLRRVRWLPESLFNTPGSWLYRRATLSWLGDPVLVRQLPRSYRFFARYCAAQRFEPIGAEMLLRGIIALRRRMTASDGIIPLRLGDVTMFLDLYDPRFLRVPSEFAELQNLLPHFLRSGDTFIDIGANHGIFSVVASLIVGREGLVLSIEPQPRLEHLLRRSLAHGPARFEIYPFACGDRSCEVEFHIPWASSGSAGVFPRHSAIGRHRTIDVSMRRLDDIADARSLPGRIFIKLDVEGSERAVLLGAERLIVATAPTMLIEINGAAMSAAGTSKAMLLQTLVHFGYDRFATPQQWDLERSLTEQNTDGCGDIIAFAASQG